jgi:UDP-N-acetylmuramoyl-L-alanyl-D-glutamate--2,6-diaminopimelate ligase
MCDRGIINWDDPASAYMKENADCPFLSYSVGQDNADFTARNIRKRPDGVDFELVGTGEIDRVRLPIPGDFSVYNAMAAATCALAIGLPFEEVAKALSETKGVKGRAEIVPVDRDYTVVIDYAHTPDGLENICRTMKECAVGRLVVLFGCGGDRDRTKRPKMGAVAAQYADLAIVTSDNPRTEEPSAIIEDVVAGMPEKANYVVIENRIEAIRYALQNAQEGDTILLAGKGHETYQVLKEGLIHLDEREVIAQVLQEERNG